MDFSPNLAWLGDVTFLILGAFLVKVWKYVSTIRRDLKNTDICTSAQKYNTGCALSLFWSFAHIIIFLCLIIS